MMPAYLRLQRTLAKVGPAVIEIPERRKFYHNLVSVGYASNFQANAIRYYKRKISFF